MYLDFYQFKEEPFHITADPEFLFLSPSHKQALASIIYGVEKRKGFVTIIGEVGVGKTTILQSYLTMIEREKLKILFIYNPNVSFNELIKTIFGELQIDSVTDDLSEMINHLHYVLIEYYQQGINVILIVDEAQNMPIDTLENLRMLSNLETVKDKLIQIVLIGQPELEHQLQRHELRQLNQRIAIRASIVALTRRESRDYIEHRLIQVGATRKSIFTRGAVRRLVKRGKGIPRTLNILCDNALITGFGRQQRPISSRIAKEVITDFEGVRRAPALRWGLACAVGVALLAGLFGLLTSKHVAVFEPGHLTLSQLLQVPLPKISMSQVSPPPASRSITSQHTLAAPSPREAGAAKTNASAVSTRQQPLDYACLIKILQGKACLAESAESLHQDTQ